MKKWLGIIVSIILLFSLVAGCIPKVEAPQKPKAKKEAPEKPKSKTEPKPESKPETKEQTATATRVIDGDTIEVEINGRIEKVRYIGINTPESNQPFGSEATTKNRELVNGKEVHLVKDVSERDKYGRLLRYVYAGSLFVNAELVKQGYANAATYPPDVKYADLFVQLEREARNKQIGLWTPLPTPAPSPPTQVAPAEVQPAPQPAQGQFVGNKNSGKLHSLAHPSCQNYVRMMSESNKVFFNSEQEGIAAGYNPCLKCY